MPTKNKKRLIKGTNPKLFGVCSGIADYADVDSTLIRIIWIIITAFTGFIPGIIAYVIAALVLPDN